MAWQTRIDAKKKRENYRTLSFLSCVSWAEKNLFTHETHLKDAKISKTKIGWFVFPRHDQAFAAANASTTSEDSALRTAHATTKDFLNQEARNQGNGIWEIEGKAARVAASESDDERVSNVEVAVVLDREAAIISTRAACAPQSADSWNQEKRKIETQSLPLAPSLLPSQLYLLSRKSLSSIPAFLLSLLNVPEFLVRRRGSGRLSFCLSSRMRLLPPARRFPPRISWRRQQDRGCNSGRACA